MNTFEQKNNKSILEESLKFPNIPKYDSLDDIYNPLFYFNPTFLTPGIVSTSLSKIEENLKKQDNSSNWNSRLKKSKVLKKVKLRCSLPEIIEKARIIEESSKNKEKDATLGQIIDENYHFFHVQGNDPNNQPKKANNINGTLIGSNRDQGSNSHRELKIMEFIKKDGVVVKGKMVEDSNPIDLKQKFGFKNFQEIAQTNAKCYKRKYPTKLPPSNKMFGEDPFEWSKEEKVKISNYYGGLKKKDNANPKGNTNFVHKDEKLPVNIHVSNSKRAIHHKIPSVGVNGNSGTNTMFLKGESKRTEISGDEEVGLKNNIFEQLTNIPSMERVPKLREKGMRDKNLSLNIPMMYTKYNIPLLNINTEPSVSEIREKLTEEALELALGSPFSKKKSLSYQLSYNNMLILDDSSEFDKFSLLYSKKDQKQELSDKLLKAFQKKEPKINLRR